MVAPNGWMCDVTASVGFCRWASAAMCAPPLCVPGMGIESPNAKINVLCIRQMNWGDESFPRA